MIEQTFMPPESRYDGDCDEFGRRNGFGIQSWLQEGKEQKYNGQFFQDCMHGEGSYEWTKGKEKINYEGNFYSNAKEGYGLVSLQNKATFEGLFCNNRPFGPGVLTYENGRQDAGFWIGSKIVRLSRVVDYIIPRLAASLEGKVKLFPYRRILYIQEKLDIPMEICKGNNELASHLYSSFLSDCRSLFFNQISYDKVYFKNLKDFHPNDLIDDLRQLKEDEIDADMEEIDISETQSVHEDNLLSKIDNHEDLENDSSLKLVCWNRSEICGEILKKIFHFRSFEGKLSFKISNLIEGNRLAFKKTGYKEKECIHFLKTCYSGPLFLVKEFLCSFKISEELMDARGNNGLMFAAANDQHEIIDILLDYGVDVDSFNDEHLTALNLCLLRLIAIRHKILNWEVAFLPPKVEDEFDDATKDAIKFEETRSIKSLDRTFGDGMSLIEGEIDLNFVEIKSMEGEDGAYFSGDDLKFKEEKSNSIWDRVPVFYKTDEYLDSVAKPTENDKYFFDLSPALEPRPPTPPSVEKKKRKGKAVKEITVVEEMITAVEEEPIDEERLKKCENIEWTIRKLLERGADPNVSEVPKFSIHLAVFSKSPKVVNILLMFGASVNARNNVNEGFLTPLHVVTLMQPSEESVEICRILLEYGGDPEAETTPEFNPNGDREIFLESQHGRTPLVLLCMRPDFQYADPKGYLIQIALLLLQLSNTKHRFRGYDYLTLAMLRGNVRLVEAFLKSGKFDPNEVLKTHGTPLHVLVSTFLQVLVPFEESLKMCDLLLDFGANPLKKWRHGCCVEYGYKEIDKEKEKRKGDKGKDKSKNKGRDHLQDQIKIVEYLRNKARVVSKEKGIDFEKEILEKLPVKVTKEARKIEKEKTLKEENVVERRKEEKEVREVVKEEKRKREGPITKRKIEKEDEEKKFGGSEKNFDTESEISLGGDAAEVKKASEKILKVKKDSAKILEAEKEILEEIIENIRKYDDVKNEVTKDISVVKVKSNKVDVYKSTKEKNIEEGKRRSFDVTDKAPSKNVSETMKRKRDKSNGHFEKTKKKTKKGEKSEKVIKSQPVLPLKKLSDSRKKFDRIPESLQKLLYNLLGQCRDSFNLNDLLLPYVVLRNGDLYYRFKGQKPKNTEAYSLI